MSSAISTTPRRVTKTDAARQLGLDIRAINRLITSGDIKVIRPTAGVRAVVLQSSVEEMAARMVGDERQAR